MKIENYQDFISFKPADCNGHYHQSELSEVPELFLIEEKYDGSKYTATFLDGRVKFTSRRTSKKTGLPVDRTRNLPHLAVNLHGRLDGTILVGEILAPSKSFGDASGTMNCNPEKAVERQERSGWLQYTVFDCLWHKGLDLRNVPLETRRHYAASALNDWQEMGNKCLWCLALSPTKPAKNAASHFRQVVRKGGEGLMIKDPKAKFGQGVFKCKKAFDLSVICSGFKPGQGKYKGQIGALKFSVITLADKELVEIGQCSGMTDKDRVDFTKNWKRYNGAVMDVTCQPPDHPDKFVPGKDRLRHPRFIRFRDDLNGIDCTDKKLIADMTSFVKGGK